MESSNGQIPAQEATDASMTFFRLNNKSSGGHGQSQNEKNGKAVKKHRNRLVSEHTPRKPTR